MLPNVFATPPKKYSAHFMNYALTRSYRWLAMTSFSSDDCRQALVGLLGFLPCNSGEPSGFRVVLLPHTF